MKIKSEIQKHPETLFKITSNLRELYTNYLRGIHVDMLRLVRQRL